jgi:hypothetical protein
MVLIILSIIIKKNGINKTCMDSIVLFLISWGIY